ncbi:MAG: hypothetical protein CVV52_07065 [Spirochaetae bacterium HGW-Spirochaetae-8]|jgi:hypothetical protein|nr:MAG: hypothetical protein CVV52_07065 [Spirochaetae bacterium HGW-Spirochaetae-8]
MKNNIYVAVIADIRDSKKLHERSVFQKKLESVLNEVNGQINFSSISKFVDNPPLFYKEHLESIRHEEKENGSGFDYDHNSTNDIASDFMITLGDEFQGLLTSGFHLVQIIDYIERSLFPIKLRFGVGIGEIHTEIKRNTPFGMDGPAYHIARDMISQLKAAERKTLEPSANIKIGIQDNDWLSLLINTNFMLLSAIKKSWTESQVHTMNVFMKEGVQKQQNTANVLGINQPSVNKALTASNFYTYQYALNVISLALCDIGNEFAMRADKKDSTQPQGAEFDV